jgi:osmotically-inducible protein OsmY
VGSAYEKDLARNDVRWIANVKDVENEIKVEWWEDQGVRKKATVPSETELREHVRAELDQDSRIDASDINIKEVSSGHVTLDGSVYSHHEKRIAEQDTRDVVGVYWVTNRLFARVDKREDRFIRDDVSFNLNTDYILEGSNIDAKVDDGVVTLSGEVQSWYDKSHAGDIAARVRGVRDVINDISVKPAPISEEHSGVKVAKDIENRFWWNWTVHGVRDQIHVSVKKGVATLTGDVDTWAQRREAQTVAFNTKGVWSVKNKLTVNGYHYPWGEWEREYPEGYPYYSDYPPYSR